MAAMYRGIGDLLILGQHLPWERERAERLMRYRFAHTLKVVPVDGRLEEQLRDSAIGGWYGLNRLNYIESVAKHGLRRLHALRLQVALVLFHREKGRAARSLNELIPDILTELPADPVTGQSFSYRLADENERPEIAPGQGVIGIPGPRGTEILVPRLR